MTGDQPDTAPEAESAPAGGLTEVEAGLREPGGSQEDFVHESVELPGWVPIAFGLVLIAIAVAAIWMAS